MINHFRSLALNTTAEGLPSVHKARNIHIDPSYLALVLPADLAEVYSVFYPTTDVTAKLQLTQSYMSLIEACGLTNALFLWDPRVTYTIVSPGSTQLLRTISVGIPTTAAAQAPGIALRVFNYEYRNNWLDGRLSRTINVEQQTNTLTVNLYENLVLLASVPLTFTGEYSQLVTVADPENAASKLFDFHIKHPTSPGFTSTAGKKWDVTFTINYAGLLSRQSTNILRQADKITSVFTKYPCAEVASYDNLWRSHFNDNYRLAGAFIGLVARMNTIREK